jgi:hypothetical protein
MIKYIFLVCLSISPVTAAAQLFEVKNFSFKVDSELAQQIGSADTITTEVEWSADEKSTYVNSLGSKIKLELFGNYAKVLILKVDEKNGWVFEKRKRNTYFIKEFGEGFSGELKLNRRFGRVVGAKLRLFRVFRKPFQPEENFPPEQERENKIVSKSCTVQLHRIRK